MKWTDFLNEVARKTDTEKTQINVADTRRVIAVMFDLLAEMEASEALDLLSKGLSQAAKRKK